MILITLSSNVVYSLLMLCKINRNFNGKDFYIYEIIIVLITVNRHHQFYTIGISSMYKKNNLTEKLQLLKLLIQKGRFETGVSDDVDELDEFVDGESMGILALVDNKEARCILKGYGENNLVNRSFLENYILNHCIDDSSITGIIKLNNFKFNYWWCSKKLVAELEKLSVLNKRINKNEENNNNNNNIYNNNNNNSNKINNTKNDAVDDIINSKLNKLNALKLDNFRENNKLVNNSNSKCKTNNNIIITKEENKNYIKGSANIKKNQNNNIEINSIVIINNKENINSNKYIINILPISYKLNYLY
ncbi:hypothetical protein U3516DRAFT_804572 [Neocallimastix sp. 'constans']